VPVGEGHRVTTPIEIPTAVGLLDHSTPRVTHQHYILARGIEASRQYAKIVATATFAPPCAIYFAAFRLWDRFRDAGWQRRVRVGLAPVTVGLIMASGVVMGRAADTSWPAVAMSIAAFGLLLTTRLNPIWLLAAGGMLGGLGVR
jgi:chromate transport protein ChrA